MNILILGIIVLVLAFVVWRKIRYYKVEEQELEEIDNFSKNDKLLDRAMALVGRRKHLEIKVNELEKENETRDKSE